jgi:hypothetical protein
MWKIFDHVNPSFHLKEFQFYFRYWFQPAVEISCEETSASNKLFKTAQLNLLVPLKNEILLSN